MSTVLPPARAAGFRILFLLPSFTRGIKRGNTRTHPSNPVGLEPRSLYLVSAAAGRTSLPDGILGLTDSLRGSSVKIGTTQRRLAWPLRQDDTPKSGSVLNCFATFATRGCWQQLAAPKNWRRPLAAKAVKSSALTAQIELASNTRGGTRAHNLLLRRQAPYPLGHTSI